MTEPILDAMRYLTPYGYDVLSFTVVHQLGASGRDKLKADGLNISDWLQVHLCQTSRAAVPTAYEGQ